MAFLLAPLVTLEGTTLAINDDFKSSIKPVSRAHFAEKLLWHSTFENATAVLPRGSGGTLDVGSGGGASGVTYQSARYGSGAYFNNTSDYINAITGINGFDGSAGAVDFWYQPTTDHTDTSTHPFWRTQSWGSNCMGFIHYNGALYFRASATSNICNTGYSEVNVPSTAYSWKAYDWVHLRVDWSASRKMRVFVNGKLVGTSATFPTLTGYPGNLVVGGCASFCVQPGGSGFPGGTIDEFHVWGGAGSSEAGNPDLIGYAGLTGVADGAGWTLDALADSSVNRTLSFDPVSSADGRMGDYLFFGADSKFRGLNVMLATPGTGTVDLQWEYWNGSAWANLEATSGFGDTTNSFTRNGNLYWTADPSNWSVYSLSGGPDLYYIRAYLPYLQSYTTQPVETRISTDILLFQYCGDISAASMTFDIPPTGTTAVRLVSFTGAPGDSSVELRWETANERDNAGFHLYRGLVVGGSVGADHGADDPGPGDHPRGPAVLLPRPRPRQRHDLLLPPRGRRAVGPRDLSRSGLRDASAGGRGSRPRARS